FLWLYGILGCGKTVLSSAIIKDLKDTVASNSILYFHFDLNDSDKRTLECMLRSLISQLYINQEDSRKHLDSLFSSCENVSGNTQPTPEQLYLCFSAMLKELEQVWIVIDALDQCITRKGNPAEGVISCVKDLALLGQANVHLLVTSRPEYDIQVAFSEWTACTESQRINIGDRVAGDIHEYIRKRVTEGEGFRRWHNRLDVIEMIITELMAKSNGMCVRTS